MIELLEVVLIVATIGFAVLTIRIKELLYAALSLAGMTVTIGLLYALLFAPLTAIFQLLIYSGASIALFISIIGFVEEETEDCPSDK